MPPLSDQNFDQDAQWSPKHRKLCFCVTSTARPLCVPWATQTVVVAQQVVHRRQRVEAEPSPWWLKSCRDRRMEAEWSPQWSLNGRYWSAKEVQWWYKAGRSIAHGRPLCIHSATTAMRVPSSCLLWATCERLTSSATFVRLFWTCSKLHGDHGVHGEVWTSSVPPLNDPAGNLSASFVPSAATWPVLWSHKGGTTVAAPV